MNWLQEVPMITGSFLHPEIADDLGLVAVGGDLSVVRRRRADLLVVPGPAGDL